MGMSRQALTDARIAILTCPFEPPKPKTKHKVDIDTVEKFEALRATEQQYFKDMVQKCKDSGERLLRAFMRRVHPLLQISAVLIGLDRCSRQLHRPIAS